MTDHSTAYPGMLKQGQLWANIHGTETLFVIRSHGRLQGIWSDGRIENAEDFANIADGKEGWKLLYPAFQEEE
ncbi:MAG: hypothetical protein ACYC69_16685 [Thermodesulfovibrionales bacterium]